VNPIITSARGIRYSSGPRSTCFFARAHRFQIHPLKDDSELVPDILRIDIQKTVDGVYIRGGTCHLGVLGIHRSVSETLTPSQAIVAGRLQSSFAPLRAAIQRRPSG
jgi:hypothetical protein